MDSNVFVAAITAGGSIVIAVTALILNYRAFNSIERRLEVIEGDLKEFYKTNSRHDTDITSIKNKIGM